jgi:UDP-2,4-diacetamido-2,4,6-trideoxy-beta-L-altropyranose hydrolase
VKVVIRVDASLKIGTGHVMRCLTLADALKQQGADVMFICREHKGNLLERIEQQGFQAYKLPECTNNIKDKRNNNTPERERLYGKQWLGSTQQQDAEQCQLILENIKPDWLIVDHYAIDHTWQALLKESYKQLMVIDDLADRVHICDLLLDQTYARKKEDYTGFVPPSCQMLLGSQYALLRSEFAQWREYSLKRRAKPELKKLLITMGGVDPDNVTGQVLNALKNCNLPQGLEITVVMGETAPNIKAVQKQAKEMLCYTQVKTAVNNMAELMANADLAIGAAGATTWERCCLGLPSMTVMLADNQKKIINLLTRLNITLTIENKKLQKIKEIEDLSQKELLVLSKNSAKVLDGKGVIRVSESIYAGLN